MNEQNIGLHSDDMDVQIGLVSAHVSGRLSGLVAQIKVRQVYKNWSETNIECVYTFPLAWQSVLLGMRVELNGNRLAGMVKPKKTAEVEYEQAIDNGDLPVMLERAGKDLYTANIGNIQPGDEAVIELDYAQILKAEDGAIRFSLPTTIAPRYGEADDAGVRLHQQAAADPQAEHRLFLSLDLSESLSAGTVHSPTHVIHTNRQGEGRTVRLASMAWLDRDFVLVIDRIGDMNFAVAAKDPVHPGEATLLTGSMFPPRSSSDRGPQPSKCWSIAPDRCRATAFPRREIAWTGCWAS
jgi:Ca-activated chloride channel family protein